MRPTKHVPPAGARAREAFDLSTARLARPGDTGVPIVAASDAEGITLSHWHTNGDRWIGRRQNHEVIAVNRGSPLISNTWNWSRHVGLAASDRFIFMVYKRNIAARDKSPARSGLLLDVLEVDDSGQMRPRVQTTIQIPGRSVRGVTFPGFELWAGLDTERRRLLVVAQTCDTRFGRPLTDIQLTLFLGDIDRLDQPDAWTSQKLDDGGYGLDARMTKSELVLAYRTRAAALQVPLPLFQIDPWFSGWPTVSFDATEASDGSFAPVRVARLDLATLNRQERDVPGGEHPRIASLDPFMLVVERPDVSARFRAVKRRDGAFAPRVDWLPGQIHKVAFMFDDQSRMARGILHTFARGTLMPFPRTASPWVDAQDLFGEPTLDGIGWASTWPRFPLEALRLDSDQKGPFLDFLWKGPRVALLRSRARLQADFAAGTFAVTERFDSVYDINHEQIGDPADIEPDAGGENGQFSPFGELGQNSGPIMQVPAYGADNTIGGSLTVDRDGLRQGFVAYTDWGDGGPRVIFDAELGPPEQPPPIENTKAFDPETVPGPGSGDEQWVEIRTADWTPMGLPFVPVSNSLGLVDTIASAGQLLMSTLVHVAGSEAGIPLDEDGWTRDEVDAIQTTINGLIGAFDSNSIDIDDGLLPAASIRVEPGTPAADSIAQWEAVVDGLTVTSAAWRFELLPPPNPIGIDSTFPNNFPVEVTGNPAPVSLPLRGLWGIQADVTLDDGSTRTLNAEAEVGPSLFTTLRTMHRSLSSELPNGLGAFRIGSATFTMIQHRIQFPVEPDQLNAQRLIISELDEVDSQWQFVAGDARQGRVAHRLRIHVVSEDVRMSGLISALASPESIDVSFFYERQYTPAVMMIDGRSAVPLTGDETDIPSDLLSGSTSHLPSSLSARPVGGGTVVPETIDVPISMLPQAIAAGVVTLLIGLGAVAAASTLSWLIATMVGAAAASLIPGVGLTLVLAAALAVAIFVAVAVPPLVERRIEAMIRTTLTGPEMRESLDELRFLQFAGEGIAEAVARAAIEQASAIPGMTLTGPAAPDAVGADRFRQDIFQMIHVSEGRCRVSIRG